MFVSQSKDASRLSLGVSLTCFCPQRTSMITIRNYAQFRGLWVSAFWCVLVSLFAYYSPISDCSDFTVCLNCISMYFLNSAQIKKIQAHRCLWPPTCQSHLGSSRSDPVKTPTQTEIQTKINTDKKHFEFEAFWSILKLHFFQGAAE